MILKKVLIICPYFPPFNAPDMHRIRMSLPYFKEFGWDARIIKINDRHLEGVKDIKLLKTIPSDIIIHNVGSLPKTWTSKVGLGSLALRSLWHYKKKVNNLLKKEKFDLVYFSTTMFPLCILGAYWKAKFGIPYIIDLQDPWHTDYYEDKPKILRPKKYWFSYHLNKYLEPIAMKHCDGLIAVSEKYINDLKDRYLNIKYIPSAVITFGYSDLDYQLADDTKLKKKGAKFLLTYLGVLGSMMNDSMSIFFNAVSKLSNFDSEFDIVLKGTSYVPGDKTKKGVPFANNYGVFNIEERPERISLLTVISEMKSCDGLLIFGTDDSGYTASKIYPYIQSRKPILAILHPQSSAYQILKENTSATVVSLMDDEKTQIKSINVFLSNVKELKPLVVDMNLFEQFSAKRLTRKQCKLFDQVI